MQKPKISVTIDGTAGSGKSTLGRRLAKKFGLKYIDSGALYRAIGWKALLEKVDFSNSRKLTEIARNSHIDLFEDDSGPHIAVDGRDVTDEIRSPKASKAASAVALVPGVRNYITAYLRELGADRRFVMEGRDIGTAVFPDADIKIYLDASLDVRAKRRLKDHNEQGISQPLDLVEGDLQQRDKTDSTRTSAPLKIADDAVVIDTSKRTLDDLEEELTSIIEKYLESYN